MTNLVGHRRTIGPAFSTVIPDLDFETYSDAGYVFDGVKFRGETKSKRGLQLVGAANYAAHPSTEILSLAYDLKEGWGPCLWEPGHLPPLDLFNHVAQGGILEAHNSLFEFFIWNYVGHLKMGWPLLPLAQLRCSMAKAKAFSLAGSLDVAGRVRETTVVKDTAGSLVMRKVSVPRNPTKEDSSLRFLPSTHPEDFKKLYDYNVQDIRAEAALSSATPDLSPEELEVWKLDQRINVRGVAIDTATVEAGIKIYEEVSTRLIKELQRITFGYVNTGSELQKMIEWLGMNGVHAHTLDEDGVADLMKIQGLPEPCKRVLEIRSILASSSVKKLYAIRHMTSEDGRLRGLFAYCGGDRTGRWAGRGPQPQNLPNSGPDVKYCEPTHGCGGYYGRSLDACPHCGNPEAFADTVGWSYEIMEYAVSTLGTCPAIWGTGVLDVVSGCLRGLFVAGPGKEFICSDYSAIEGVVAAMISGEQWRIDVFRTHGKIYEMGASKITGVPFEEMMQYKKDTGEHHPTRKKIGKVSELASGFGGWIGAWERFGAGEFMTAEEMKTAILAWREASPAIVEMWGGQHRKHPDRWEFTPELFGLEGACVLALLNPGQCYTYRGFTYGYSPEEDVLYCQLLSGRYLHYHKARLAPITARNGMLEYQISYEGTGPTPGSWVTQTTYSGKLFENVVQATARDILAHGLINLDRAGYPIVMHIHDEVVTEVPEGTGSIEEVERIMAIMPPWAHDWPIKAAGGWRGKRYRKD